MNMGFDSKLYQEVAQFGARDMEICMQCGTCSASCPISTGTDPFPRKIYRYLQLGLRDKLLGSPVPWLCYYCGECNEDCPRGAEPAETMMAARRWLTTQYDRTGLARRFYLSGKWEIGALSVLAIGIVLLFWFFHGPILTDRVAVNSFAPVKWIEIGDLIMAAVLFTFLLSNAIRMFGFVMGDTKVPLRLYVTQAKTFIWHFMTQKRWRQCGEDRSLWVKHFILVTGYMTMMTLIIVCIRWFQVDDSSWHFTSLFGYYATGALLFVTAEMFHSRMKKEAPIHRFSELSDWLFLILLFFTSLTGILMHAVRLAGWPMGTYVLYVIHLAIAVPMLVIEVPFGKWSHLFYRPLAMFLVTVKEKAAKASIVDPEVIAAEVGETFQTCLQCGVCTSVCPLNWVSAFSPRHILRHLSMDTATEQSVDQAVWRCLTCNACGVDCPRSIDLIDVLKAVRSLNVTHNKIPVHLAAPLASLEQNANPFNGDPRNRDQWAADLPLPRFQGDQAYCLFTCCATAYEPVNQKAGRALIQLLRLAGVSFGTLGAEESCCGDQAQKLGALEVFSALFQRNTDLFSRSGVQKLLTLSPHCLNAFKKGYGDALKNLQIEHYTQLLERLLEEGALRPKRAVESIVTYHDPCYLGRHNGIYEAPRRILQRIPGLQLVEMPNNRAGSLCCGSGSGNSWGNGFPDKRLGRVRIQEALNSGAAMIATACPYCMRMLNDAVTELGLGDQVSVRDLAELLLQSLTITAEEETKAHIAEERIQEVSHV